MSPGRKSAGGESGFRAEAARVAAADWLARRECGLTADEQERFSEWLLADERHAAMVREIESAWRFMQKPRYTRQADLVERSVERRVHHRARRQRWRLAIGGLAAAAAVVFGLVSLREPDQVKPVASAGRVEVRPERRVLPDGSIVELNAAAEITVHFSAGQRGVRLIQGEAHFAVAKDAARPFVVTASVVVVRAVGTEFAVRVAPATVNVLVTEGRVAVARVEPAPPANVPPVAKAATYLEAGTRAIVPVAAPEAAPLEIEPVAAAQIETALAWRSLRVEFTATPLAEIVARLNRQNSVQLSLADPDLAGLRISGIFWLDDPKGFSRLAGASAGLQVTSGPDGRIVFSRR